MTQKMKSVQEEANKILAEGEARTADFLKNTTESKIAALNKDYDETVLALNQKNDFVPATGTGIFLVLQKSF